jgi:type IV secretory pathway VirB2 component (pilin)
MHTLIHSKPPRPRLAALRARWRRLAPSLLFLTALPVYAQSTGSDPWDNAVNVLKTAFTGTIATGLSLVAIVVGGLMFAYGEGQSKKILEVATGDKDFWIIDTVANYCFLHPAKEDMRAVREELAHGWQNGRLRLPRANCTNHAEAGVETTLGNAKPTRGRGW